MKSGIVFALFIFSSLGYAKNDIYKFKDKVILLVDANTGAPVKDEKINIFHKYEYACLTDGIRPSKCVNGSETTLDVVQGRVDLKAQMIEKVHLTGRKPGLDIQVSGTCEGQEWHPGDCQISIPLSEFNSAANPMTIKVPFKTKKSSSGAAQPGSGVN